MRFALAGLVLAFAGAGCFGSGCFTSGYRLVWEQPDVLEALQARATPEAEANRTLTFQPAPAGIPFDSTFLPVADAENASLIRVTMSWGGSWSGEVKLRVLRDGNLTISALYDSGDRKSSVQGRLAAFMEAISDAPEAERTAAVDELLADWNARSNEIKLSGSVSPPMPLRIDDLFNETAAIWTVDAPGDWFASDGKWEFRAALATWTLDLQEWREESVIADVAGWIAGPILRVAEPSKEPGPDVAGLHALTMLRFDERGLPEPHLADAATQAAGRICID